MRKVWVTLLAMVFVAVGLAAQEKMGGEKKEKAAAAAKKDRWSGVIIRTNKDKSTLTVQKGNIEKTVVYDSSTHWTKGKTSAEQSEFKEGEYVICLGKWNDKNQLMASRIDLRPPK